MPRKSQVPSKPKRKHVSFEKRVLNVVNKQAETKLKVVSLFNNTNLTSGGLQPSAGTGLQIQNILQNIGVVQGTEQEERQGNQIQNCRLSFRGLIETLEYNASTNNNIYGYECHIVFFKHKTDPNGNIDSLKVLPSNLTGPVDGTLINTMYPYNKDMYIIKKVKIIRMNSVIPNTSYVQPSQDNTFNYKRFRVDIPIKKILKFNDGVGFPSNEWCSVGVFIVNGDGDATTGKIRAQMTMDAQLRYDDY